MDMSTTIIPKSDQLNADDLITGPRIITITALRGMSDRDQPVAVSFEGDNGKPYKPCLSMRRVMVHCWGKDAQQYVGRRMKLYLDPEVKFGGMKVGGIRISHMSHIEGQQVMGLTASKARRAQYTVNVLEDQAPPPDFDPVALLDEARLEALKGTSALKVHWESLGGAKQKALSGDLNDLKAMASEADADGFGDGPA